MIHVNREIYNQSKEKSIWDFGNNFLYDLCKKYPAHQNDDEIATKILFIGRIYAAAIERRKTEENKVLNDDFYFKDVIPKIKASSIDEWLAIAKQEVARNNHSIQNAVEIHGKVTKLFRDISGLDKRSLASKYLHFHVPELFYIYDSRAEKTMQELFKIEKNIPALRKETKLYTSIDKKYLKFTMKCNALAESLREEFDQRPSPRQVDNYLLLSFKDRKKILNS